MTDAECLVAVQKLKKGGFFCPKLFPDDQFVDYFERLTISASCILKPPPKQKP